MPTRRPRNIAAKSLQGRFFRQRRLESKKRYKRSRDQRLTKIEKEFDTED